MDSIEAVTDAVPHARAGASRPSLPRVRRRVLVAEEQAATRGLLTRALRAAGYEVTELADGRSLWNELRLLHDPHVVNDPYGEAVGQVDLVVSGARMPGLDGVEVLARLRANGWDTPVLLVGAVGDADARGLGAEGIFDLPVDVEGLVEAARSVVEPE
jgi:CheY-like chemotaxis protein